MDGHRRWVQLLLGTLVTVACVAAGAGAATAIPGGQRSGSADQAAPETRTRETTDAGHPRPRPTDRTSTSAEDTHAAQHLRTRLPVQPAPAPPPTSGNVVYLTFDDGPAPGYTPQVLDVLARYQAPATFFMIGRQAQANPSLLAAVRAGGHAVGNHTYSHPWLTRLSNGAISREISSAATTLGGTHCLRPPGGFVDGRVTSIANSLGQAVVTWTVDPLDWQRPGAGAIADRVLRAARPGSVILMHDGGGDRSQSVAALTVVLARLTERGYGFGTLPQCR